MSQVKTSAERQRAYRARKAQQQLTEVRGIFAHPEDHGAIKSAAAKINKRRSKS